MTEKEDTKKMRLLVIAEEMKKYAAEHPMMMANMVQQLTGDAAAIYDRMEPFRRNFEFDGYDIRVTLTFDILLQQRGWHCSIGSMASGLNVPDRVCQALLPYFLPMKSKPVEIPSMMHGPRVRQFVELVG